MEALDKYQTALQEIYDHVGFTEDWVICPIDDRREFFWKIIDDSQVGYADTLEELESEDGNYYEDEIYTQRFYKKHVYEGAEFTLVFVDTHTDGMKYFAIYDNSKRK